MELTGIRVDKKYLLNLKEELEAKMKLMQEEIYKLADVEFNILSPKQLGEVLFDKLKIEYPKKRKKDEKETVSGRKRNGNRLYGCVK